MGENESKPTKPIEIQPEDDAKLVSIDRGRSEEERSPIYTSDEQVDLKNKGLSSEEIKALQAARIFVKDLLNELKINDVRNLNLTDENDQRKLKLYQASIEGYYRKNEDIRRAIDKVRNLLGQGYEPQVIAGDEQFAWMLLQILEEGK